MEAGTRRETGMAAWIYYPPRECPYGNTLPLHGIHMIRVVDIAEPPDVTVAADEYICLTLTWPADPVRMPVYWRPGDHKRSLIEVGIHPETGIPVSISIVLPGSDVEVQEGQAPLPVRLVEFGHPVFDLTPWGRDWLFTETIPFRIVVYAGSATVWFTPAEEAVSDLVAGRVRFHLSAGREFIGFSVHDLPETEIARLKETLAWLMATAGMTLQPGEFPE